MDEFNAAKDFKNLNVMWEIFKRVVISSADNVVSRHWFSEFDCQKNKQSSKFFRLELLVAKLMRCVSLGQKSEAVRFFEVWSTLDSKGASKACTMFSNNESKKSILQHLSEVKKLYRKFKYYESRAARDTSIRKAIDKRMENFSSNKELMIKSVLEKPFRKVVLDHLIVDDELILEPKEVLSAVNSIMEDWTRKRIAPISVFVQWYNQYAPLDYVSNNAFSNVMSVIRSDEFLLVVNKLPDGKAKHENMQVLSNLLDILNVYLKLGVGTLTNTRPIALVEITRKILLKVFSDRISLAYSKFDVLHGDNFSVLKSTSTQIPIFTIGSIIEDALEKNRELWLVLQDMRKAYDSVGWPYLRKSLVRIKMCSHFIEFFGNIHNSRTNQVITNFGLTGEYTRIFYDPLFCEIKKHEQLCKYRLESKFITRTGRADSKGGKTSFFAAGAFVDNTIWVGNCLVATQRILNIATLYYPELYGLKTFEQVMSENMLAGLVKFANTDRIFGELFEHRALELQATSWMPQHLFKFLIKLLVNSANCFLAGTTHVLKLCNLLLSSDLSDVFQARNCVAILNVLGFEAYLGIKRLDPRDPVPVWFASLVKFIIGGDLSNSELLSLHSAPAGFSCDFSYVSKHLLNSGLGSIPVYTNGSVKNLGLLCACDGAATYFLNVDTGVRVKMDGLLSSTLAEMQAIALALECMPISHSVDLYTDSQASLDILPYQFLIVEGKSVFENAHHIAKKLFNAVYTVGWEARCVDSVVNMGLDNYFDKARIFCVWHPDDRIKSGHTSTALATLWSYLMKTLHYCLPVAKRKKMYNLSYSSIACIWCGLVEDSDHVFSCDHDVDVRNTLLSDANLEWDVLLGASANGNAIAGSLNETASSMDLYIVLAKGFVLKSWVVNMVGWLGADSDEGTLVVNFICCFTKNYRSAIWLPVAKLRVYYKKHNFLPCDELPISLVSGLAFL
ncbi:hypothetical protein G9A89_003096 [Geosiphon pyriformis]|nr:hypothetical protein G9A89_003096 [Geosiphon pyriformis]